MTCNMSVVLEINCLILSYLITTASDDYRFTINLCCKIVTESGLFILMKIS